MFPVIWLRDKSMSTITTNFVMFGDNDPTREFNDKSKNIRFLRLHKFNGIDDVSLLWLRYNVCKGLRFPMQFGMDPKRLLFERVNSPKFCNLQSCFEMNPSILLSSRRNLCKLSNPPNDDGIFPVKLFPVNSSAFKLVSCK